MTNKMKNDIPYDYDPNKKGDTILTCMWCCNGTNRGLKLECHSICLLCKTRIESGKMAYPGQPQNSEDK